MCRVGWEIRGAGATWGVAMSRAQTLAANEHAQLAHRGQFEEGQEESERWR